MLLAFLGAAVHLVNLGDGERPARDWYCVDDDDAPVDAVERSESLRPIVSLFRRHLARSSAV
jgi:hypothetical protein